MSISRHMRIQCRMWSSLGPAFWPPFWRNVPRVCGADIVRDCGPSAQLTCGRALQGPGGVTRARQRGGGQGHFFGFRCYSKGALWPTDRTCLQDRLQGSSRLMFAG